MPAFQACSPSLLRIASASPSQYCSEALSDPAIFSLFTGSSRTVWPRFASSSPACLPSAFALLETSLAFCAQPWLPACALCALRILVCAHELLVAACADSCHFQRSFVQERVGHRYGPGEGGLSSDGQLRRLRGSRVVT